MALALLAVTFLLFTAQERLGSRLPAVAHRRLIIASTLALGVCAGFGIAGLLGLRRSAYLPLLIVPIAVVAQLIYSLFRGKTRPLNLQLAAPDRFERMRDDMQIGFDLGFTTARVETTNAIGGKELLLLSMVGHNDTIYTAQILGKRHDVGFSTFFDDGRYDLTTQRNYQRMAPRSLSRVVSGTPAEMFAAHRVDVAAMVAAGHRPMTADAVDLVEVSATMLSTHQIDMGREWAKTLWRTLVPPRSILHPIVPVAG